MSTLACDECLRRTWLLGRLSGHINNERGHLAAILELGDAELIRAVSGKLTGRVQAEYDSWGHQSAQRARADAARAGLELICCCQQRYPSQLRDLGRSAPWVLHVAGGMERFLTLCAADPVAMVGARRCTPYGRSSAHDLAREVALTGITIVSGMASGIDSAVHEGVLISGGNTIAVMPAAANASYPASAAGLHRRIIDAGAAVSELGLDVNARAWSFRARNRIIVALAVAVVVIQALPESGTMRTATIARNLERRLGALPGQVRTPASDGPHQLIREGRATLIRGSEDVLDLVGIPRASTSAAADATNIGLAMSNNQHRILTAITSGHDTAASLAATGIAANELLKDLAQLELMGRIRQEADGRLLVRH